jgi:RNA polymerase sigma-70 factor (ECF subfamily)
MTARAFEQAARGHGNRVHSLAYWMLRDREEAGDVSQEALMRLWQHRDQVSEETARSWLLRTTHHLCLDQLRRRAVRSGPDLASVSPRLRDGAPSPDRAAGSVETAGAIASALATLSPRDRAIVLLREVEGLPYEEIAGILELPLGTLKVSLHRSRERLRRFLTSSGVSP